MWVIADNLRFFRRCQCEPIRLFRGESGRSHRYIVNGGKTEQPFPGKTGKSYSHTWRRRSFYSGGGLSLSELKGPGGTGKRTHSEGVEAKLINNGKKCTSDRSKDSPTDGLHRVFIKRVVCRLTIRRWIIFYVYTTVIRSSA